jgi:hypothetical protein
MRQVAAVRNLDVGQTPDKDTLADALESDGVPPAVVAAIPDEDVHDPEAIQATVDNYTADVAYRAGGDDHAVEDATEAPAPEPDALHDRIAALERTVEDLTAEVQEANERLRIVQALVEGDYGDDIVAEVLRNRADELVGNV